MTGYRTPADADRFVADPVGDAVLWWVAESGSAVQTGACDALIDTFDEHVTAAPPLFRGVPDPQVATLTVGQRWDISDAGPWAAFTERPDYAALWAEGDGGLGAVLRLDGDQGVSLPALADTLPGLADDPAAADAYYEGETLLWRIGNEREWLVRGQFEVVAVETATDGHPAVVTIRRV